LKNIYITNHDGMMKLKINKTFIKWEKIEIIYKKNKNWSW
jgi:hypothetical protein